MLEKIKNDGKDNAQEDGRSEREIERRVFATINDIAGKAAERKVSASEEEHDASGESESDSEDDQQFSEIRHSSVRFTSFLAGNNIDEGKTNTRKGLPRS